MMSLMCEERKKMWKNKRLVAEESKSWPTDLSSPRESDIGP